MKTRPCRLLLAVTAMCTFAIPLSAQTLFVEGAILASIERSTEYGSVTGATNTNGGGANGTVAGGGVSIGHWLTPRVTVRLEVSLPGRHVERAQIPIEIQTVGDALTGVPVTVPAYTDTREQTRRLRTASAMLGYHLPRRRHVSLAYLGGVAFGARTVTQTVETFQLRLTPTRTIELVAQRLAYRATSYGIAAIVGMEGDVQMIRHLSVVPQIRGIGYDGVSVRPAVALRATW